MVNAHPCILSQLFKKHHLECPHLDEYIANREEHLESVMRIIDAAVAALLEDTPKNRVINREHDRKSLSLRRDQAKTQFLRVMYGGKPNTLSIGNRDKQSFRIDWTPPDFLRLFHKEFQQNPTTLLSLSEFKRFLKDHNPLGTGLSFLAQDIVQTREPEKVPSETGQYSTTLPMTLLVMTRSSAMIRKYTPG